MLNPELREKFKKLYFEKFNISLSDEQATEMFTNFINLMKVILKPNTNQKAIESFQEDRSENETITV